MAKQNDAGEKHADEIAAALTRLQRLRERTFAQVAAMTPDELELSAFHCLLRLASDGPMRSGALAEAVYADPSSVSRQVAQLVARGHVERMPDPVDGRASVLAVTDSGRSIVDDMQRRRAANVAQVVANWPDTDIAEFARLLDRFVTDYERARPQLLAAIRRKLGIATSEEDRTA